jgi:hypothetical protein
MDANLIIACPIFGAYNIVQVDLSLKTTDCLPLTFGFPRNSIFLFEFNLISCVFCALFAGVKPYIITSLSHTTETYESPTDSLPFSHLDIWKVAILTLSLAVSYAAVEMILILTLRVGRQAQH